MSKKSELDIAVGRALHRLRQERKKTVTSLAVDSGISQAMVSRIENGQVSPSLSTLAALAQTLNVPVMALLTGSEDAVDVHHLKADEGLRSRRVTNGHAHEYLLLGKHTGPGGSFQSARIRIDRDTAGTLPRYQHEGHTFIYVMSGTANYSYGSETFELDSGDTLSFDAKFPHGFVEITSDHIEIITVFSRPN